MPLVEKWRLPISNLTGEYREFDRRTEYLDYLRGRRRMRLSDRRYEQAQQEAFSRIHDDIHRASSWEDVAILLTKHDRDFRLLIDDHEFRMISCQFTDRRTTDVNLWTFRLTMKIDFDHELLRKQREKKQREKREWLDMRNRAPQSFSNVLNRLQIVPSGSAFRQGASTDMWVNISKQAFPEIAVMELMTAPPKKIVFA